MNEIKQSITQESVADIHEADEEVDWAACMAMNDEVEVVGSGSTGSTGSKSISKHVRLGDRGLFREKNIKKNSSPFIWWSANYVKYPILGQLAKGYLSAPMGCVPSEQEFKQAKRFVMGRWNLKTENVEKCLFKVQD